MAVVAVVAVGEVEVMFVVVVVLVEEEVMLVVPVAAVARVVRNALSGLAKSPRENID